MTLKEIIKIYNQKVEYIYKILEKFSNTTGSFPLLPMIARIKTIDNTSNNCFIISFESAKCYYYDLETLKMNCSLEGLFSHVELLRCFDNIDKHCSSIVSLMEDINILDNSRNDEDYCEDNEEEYYDSREELINEIGILNINNLRI